MDITSLLEPISGDEPTGGNLRYDPVYDELMEMRREDDPRLPRGVWKTKLKAADWSGVIALATQLLQTRSKDLQVAACLVEALTVREGLAGARTGFELLRGLVERYWHLLWPPIAEDGDLEARLAPLEWLDSRIAERVLLITAADNGDPPPTFHDLRSLQLRRTGNPDAATKRADEGFTAEFERVTAATSADFYLALWRELVQCSRALDQLRAAMNESCGEQTPSFHVIRHSLEAIAGVVQTQLAVRGLTPAIEEPEMAAPPINEADATMPATDTPNTPQPHLPDGPIASRAEAYRILGEVARFLEAQEPHSPVPLLLRRAISWGRMPLPDLLAELMQEEGGPFRLLGVTPRGTP